MNTKNKIDWYRTSFGEAEANGIVKALKEEKISQGPVTVEFEELLCEKLNVPYVVVTTSGSVALLMSLMAIDLKPGDEVIVPNRTWIATAHAALILGATVKLVDVLPEKTCLDCSQVERAVTSKTKAILPVHLNGRSVDMIKLRKIATRHNLVIIEDACQAFLSKNSEGYLGTQSDFGCYSFGVTKLVATGQGGAIVTHDKNLYQRLCLLRTHGTVSNINAAYSMVGCNFKFTDLLAAVGVVQLSKAEDHVRHVKSVYQTYLEGLIGIKGIKMIPVDISTGEVPLYVEVLVDDRQKLMSHLEAQNIHTRPFLPNVQSAPYLTSEYERVFENSDRFNKRGLFLPSGPSQSLENVARVISEIRQYLS